MLKNVDYYVYRKSNVFVCFVDFCKAFDHVNYWKLFNDYVNLFIIKPFAYWYCNQEISVHWRGNMSYKLKI